MRKGIWKTFLLIVAGYVLANCLLTSFVPLLHSVRLDFIIVDDTSNEPIRGAELAWVWANPATGFQWTERIGITDEEGRVGKDITIQEQPLWCYPLLGDFRFDQHKVQLSKRGYANRTIRLRDASGQVPYRRPKVSMKLTMTRS